MKLLLVLALLAPPMNLVAINAGCGSGLASEDLSGHCRCAAAPTPGALEATDENGNVVCP